MKSLEELDSLRERLKKDMSIREQGHEIKVTVSMGTCGIAAGARETVKALLEEMKEQGLSGVSLTQTSCAGLCHYEPLLEVSRGSEKTTYVKIDREKAKEIVKKHLVEGKVVEEWTAR